MSGFTQTLKILTFFFFFNEPLQDLGIPDSTPGPHRILQQQDQHACQEPGPGVGTQPPQVTTSPHLKWAPSSPQFTRNLDSSKLSPLVDRPLAKWLFVTPRN